MKLKYAIKKNGQETHSKIVDSTQEGDSWVEANKAAFGRNEMALYEDQLAANGVTAEQAASSEQEEYTDYGGQPATRTKYFFAKDYEVEVTDETVAIDKQEKIQDRSQARAFCLTIIDEIASINKEANDPALMAALLGNQSMSAIMLMLLTGGTATARALMAQHGPSLYPQATVDALLAKMDAYIASES